MKITLSENIRAMRKEHAMTQEQLAQALGVTVGAVSKWESGASVPEVETIVELAEFFETSVDVLLGYGWHKSSMGEAAERIRSFRGNKEFQEGMAYAEKALQKFPNSFDVVYQSAMLYYLQISEKSAARALELFQRCCELIDQNTNENVSLVSLENYIATCYANMQQYDKAIALLKKNNFGGVNNAHIGSIMSQHMNRPDEALQYLSEALYHIQGELTNIALGFANAYAEKGQYDEAMDIMLWTYQISQGLKKPGAITYIDKTDARCMMLCAECAMLQGKRDLAKDYLRQTISIAKKFDASPVYSMEGVKFYHGRDATSYDDFGETALGGIRDFIYNPETDCHLQPIWEELMVDQDNQKLDPETQRMDD